MSAAEQTTSATLKLTVAKPDEQTTKRIADLTATDAQFRAALPLQSVNEAKLHPDLGLAQIVELIMQAYADRPALAQRATQLSIDPTSGRTTRQVLPHFDTVTYRDVWSRARALATAWYTDEHKSLRANDFLCILAFAGIEFATVDMAAIHNGAVVVPLQTNGALTQLHAIFKEVEPRWLAASLESLNTAVELVLHGHRPIGLLVFDYHPEVDCERQTFEAARARLTEAGLPDLLVTLDEQCTNGSKLEPAPLFAGPATDKRLCTIYYTSGSTGLPKGAMYPEQMIKPMWRMISPISFFYMHYMPMNHSFGRSGVFSTFGAGGICYFTAKSDLSMLFEDIRLARPTFMGIVPRICEMVYQHYQVELERRSPGSRDRGAHREGNSRNRGSRLL